LKDDNTIRKSMLKLVRMVQKLKNDEKSKWFTFVLMGSA